MTPQDNVMWGLFTILMLIAGLLAILIMIRLERILDRYRLKYGFDRELEAKEISGKEEDKPERLNKRERLFKRRVFKD